MTPASVYWLFMTYCMIFGRGCPTVPPPFIYSYKTPSSQLLDCFKPMCEVCLASKVRVLYTGTYTQCFSVVQLLKIMPA